VQILPLEATALQSNKFGQYYEVRGRLTGPNGVGLAVRTIRMTEHLSGLTKFVILFHGQDEPNSVECLPMAARLITLNLEAKWN
jgi:hypothetical protein